MMRPRAVLFSLAGILVESPAVDVGSALAAALGLGPERAPDITSLVVRTAAVSPAVLAEHLQRELGLVGDATAAVTAVWEAQRTEPVVLADAAGCLGAVHAAGARVAILANTWTPAADAARVACAPFAASIDRWHLSCEVGAAKPSAAFFTAALVALEVAPADALMVGESPTEDIAPALALGLGAVWLRRDAGFGGAIAVDPHGAPLPVPAAIVPESAIVARRLADVRRIVLTRLWATRGVRADLTAPLPA